MHRHRSLVQICVWADWGGVGICLLLHIVAQRPSQLVRTLLTHGATYAAGVLVLLALGLGYYALQTGGLESLAQQLSFLRANFSLTEPKPLPEMAQLCALLKQRGRSHRRLQSHCAAACYFGWRLPAHLRAGVDWAAALYSNPGHARCHVADVFRCRRCPCGVAGQLTNIIHNCCAAAGAAGGGGCCPTSGQGDLATRKTPLHLLISSSPHPSPAPPRLPARAPPPPLAARCLHQRHRPAQNPRSFIAKAINRRCCPPQTTSSNTPNPMNT